MYVCIIMSALNIKCLSLLIAFARPAADFYV